MWDFRSEKWELRSEMWDFRSEKSDLGKLASHFSFGIWEMGSGIETRILIFKTLPSAWAAAADWYQLVHSAAASIPFPLPFSHLPIFGDWKREGGRKRQIALLSEKVWVSQCLFSLWYFLGIIISEEQDFAFKGSESFGEEFDRRWRARAFNTRSLPPSIPKAETTAWLVKRI